MNNNGYKVNISGDWTCEHNCNIYIQEPGTILF